MSYLSKLWVLGIIMFVSLFSYGQTGPGGIGNIDGTDGQPVITMWFLPDSLGLTDGNDVLTWTDHSGNGYDLTAASATSPIFRSNALNGHDYIEFSKNDNRIVRNPFDMPSDAVSVFIVLRSTDGGDGLLSYAVTGQSNEYLFYNSNSHNTYIGGNNTDLGVDYSDGNWNIMAHQWRNVDGRLYLHVNGTEEANTTHRAGYAITQNGSLAIGGEQDAVDGGYTPAQDYDGDIAEIIIYGSSLNQAQRTVIENYLAQKYGLDASLPQDYYVPADASYIVSLSGVGKENDGFSELSSDGFVAFEETNFDNGEYLMAAHDGSANSVDNSPSVVHAEVEASWSRNWYLYKPAGTDVDVNIGFDLGDGIGGDYPIDIDNYRLLYKATPGASYDTIESADRGITNGDQIYFLIENANLASGYYTLGTIDQTNSPVEGAPARTWYTLISGDWEDWETWTLDPSGALPDNPGHNIPSEDDADRIVILSGRSVTVNSNNINNAFIKIDGEIDFQATTGHSFYEIQGSGRIRLAGDNFPSGNASNFYTEGKGEGTVEYYGTSFTLAQNLEFFNLNISLDDPNQTLTLMTDYTINGDLLIDTGELQINNFAIPTARNIIVYGDVNVSTEGKILTGTANARHQFDFYGDLNNNGIVKFTNRAAPNYTSEATNGIVDANFINDFENQQINCDSTTFFYRIEIDKGTDMTYELLIRASNSDHFEIYGYANQGHGSVDQLATNDNALGLLRGTVRIGNNVSIDVLNNSGNYNVSEAARLWVDGGFVAKNSGTAIVPYGEIDVTKGTLEARVNSGITTRGNGLIKVEGGTINTNQIRTSVLGAENVGGYVQSGGTTNILGTSTNGDYYCFNLTYSGNVFNMSGGTLHIHEAHGKGGLFIASSEVNQNVTGGTVIFEIDDSNDFNITSAAPFYDVILRNSSGGSGEHILAEGVDVGATDEDLAAQPLVVLNDLTIEADAFLNHDGNDVYIGRDFYIDRDAQTPTFDDSGISDSYNDYNVGYLFDQTKPNNTVFNGEEDGEFYIGYNTSDGFEQYFHNIVIEKSGSSRVTVVCDTEKTAQYQEDNGRNHWYARIVRVQDTLKVNSGIFDQGQSAFRLYGPLSISSTGQCGVYEQGVTHKWAWVMLKDADLNISTETGAIMGNVKMNPNPTTDIINFTSDVYIKRIGYFHGRINLQSNELKLDYLHDGLTENNYDISNGRASDEMFYTTGADSDGGLLLYIPAGTADGTDFPFPLGVAGKYTPAEVRLSNVTDDGYISIRPVDGELQTTDLSGGDLLDYYWKIDYEDFSSLPTIDRVRFEYNNADIVGNENNYVAGKVLNVYPFEREYEDDDFAQSEGVDAGNNRITFNGQTDAGFTLEKASYTAGVTGRFTGSPEIFYVRANGDWDNGNTWSYSRGGGAAGDYPQAGDIAIMRRLTTGYSGIVNIRTAQNAAAVIYDDENGFSSGCPRIVFTTDNNYAAYDSYFQVVDVADTHEGGTLTYNTHGAVVQYNINDDYSNANSSLQFDGNDDFIAIQSYNYTAAQTALTVEAWIKTSSGSDQVIASYDRNEYWRLEVNGEGGGTGQIGFDLMTDAGQLDFGGSTRIDDGNWHHIAAVYDNGNVYIYVDGNLDNSTSSGTTFGSGNTRYGFIGVGSEADVFNGSTGPTNYFDGNISEFRVWNIARSQGDIQSTMNGALAGTEPGLVMYHKLDGNGSDATATDYSSNGYDGDLQNFSLPGSWQTIHPWGSAFPGGDFGGFNDYPNALVIYGWDGATANADITLSAQANEYPQMWFSGGNNSRVIRFPNTDMTIKGGFTIPGQVIVVANGESKNTITFEQNVNVGHPTCCGFQGQFLMPGADPESVTIDIKKNLKVTGNANSLLGIENAASGISIHRIKVAGNVSIEATGGKIQLGDGDVAKSNVELELTGESDNTFTNNYAASHTPQFYRIIMNKGADTTYSFAFNNTFTLTGSTDGVDEPKAVELENGLLIFDDASINVDLTTGDDDFYIPGSSGLELRTGQLNANGSSGIRLDGMLRNAGGTIDMSGGDNYIEYSASGNAKIDVSDGTLIVGGQIRRGLSSTQGILQYYQSGGEVVVGNNSAPENSRGVLEIANNGSRFNLTGGTLYINRAQSSPQIAAFYLDPQNSTISGEASIHLGYSNTPASQEIGVYSTVDLPKLVADNSSGNTPTIKQWVVPLTITDTLLIQAGADYDANGLDLTVSGNFINNGTFIPNGNTTYFNGTANQVVNGASATSFYNLTYSSDQDFSITNDVLVSNIFDMATGTFTDNDNTLTVEGNINFGGTHNWGGSSNGIYLNGNDEQIMTGAGTYARLTIENSDGVSIDPNTGSDIAITNELQLNEGVLDIDQYLLYLQTNAEITTTAAFDENTLVQTNISFTDAGILKDFPAIAATTDYEFPVGVGGKYTPVSFSIDNVDAGGSIRIKAANEMQPTITDDNDETCEFDDLQNVLQYHWILEAVGINNFTADMTMEFDPTDAIAVNTCGYDTSHYIAARILTYGDNTWNKYDYSNFNGEDHLLEFRFDGTDDDGISGDYTAGIEQPAPNVNGAIPNEVTEFITLGDGDWDNPNNWAKYDSDLGYPAGVGIAGDGVPASGPRGAVIYVHDNHTLTIPDNYISAYKTIIQPGAILDIGTTFGHRLGIVSGTGTLYVERGELPAGIYDNFFSSSGGTLEFGSTDIYTMSITEVNNLTISGDGTADWKYFPNNNVTVNGDIVVNGGAAYQKSQKTLFLYGDLIFNSGYFRFDYYTYNEFHFVGSEDQSVTGELNANNKGFKNIIVNKSAGELNLNNNVRVERYLDLQNGVVNTGSTNTFNLTSSASIVGGSSSSYVNGPLYVDLNSSTNFTFPIGTDGDYRPIGIVNPDDDALWKAEYFSSNAISDLGAGLQTISANNRWVLEDVNNVHPQAKITLYWGEETNVSPNTGDHGELRVAYLDGSNIWQDLGNSAYAGSATSGWLTSSTAASFSTVEFTIASSTTDNPLPVTLVDFTAKVENENQVALSWKTTSEIDNDYFIVERSRDGVVFEEVNRVNGNGTTTELSNYQTTDYDPYTGISYYRLRQVDYNGQEEIFPMVVIEIKSMFTEEPRLNIHPNPYRSGDVVVDIGGFNEQEEALVMISDISGSPIWQGRMYPTRAEMSNIVSDQLEAAQSGFYLVIVVSSDRKISARIIKE